MNDKKDTTSHKYTNQLINETSPYLLQHAHNPVNWHPWSPKTLQKAKEENKMLLISIGYSACHWCHVMEHESFEDEEVAQLMNDYFIPVKVDREERPDVDQIYMSAIQVMGQNGGWPLNFFATPEGKPFWGGTYFPKAQWKEVLKKVNHEWVNDPKKVEEFATNLTNGVQQSEVIQLKTAPAKFDKSILQQSVTNWKQSFDNKDGGALRENNKFPLPNNYQFLLRYGHLNRDKEVLDHVELTLKKLAFGGIYDQIGGGFSRYSVDKFWKVPHFEKMLYDNAQLVSLYSEAYQYNKNPLYKQIVFETLAFIKRELTAENGAFYSALDADSEGEEGKYYVWKKEDLQEILGNDFKLFADYFNVNSLGFWEHGNYILLRDKKDDEIAKKYNLSIEELSKKIESLKNKLQTTREKRTRPGLDDKSLTSWNALMLKAYVDAYLVFQEQDFLDAALVNTNFIIKHQLKPDGSLFHNYKNRTSNIDGYLEDYSFTTEAFIKLYEATFDEKWLDLSLQLMSYVQQHFYDSASGMFFFTSDIGEQLVARKMEAYDNVIPSSNSSLAKSLFKLGHLYGDETYLKLSSTMLNNMTSSIARYGSGYSNWAMLLLNHTYPYFEIVISGKEAKKKRDELNKYYLPNKLLIGSEKESELPLFKSRWEKDLTDIYVCVNKVCKAPVEKVDEAIQQIEELKSRH